MRMWAGAITGVMLVAAGTVAIGTLSSNVIAAEPVPPVKAAPAMPAQTDAANAAAPDAATGGVSQGSAALMLASLIAPYEPSLDGKRRAALAVLGDNGASIFERIELNAANVSCRTSNVAIGAYGCDMKFANGATTALKGRKAHELYATMLENGVPVEGAAGSLQAQINELKCVIEPRVLAQNAGGGAYCGWKSS